VVLDEDEATRAGRQDGGETPAAGPDLEHGLVPAYLQRVGNPFDKAAVGEKMLAETLSNRRQAARHARLSCERERWLDRRGGARLRCAHPGWRPRDRESPTAPLVGAREWPRALAPRPNAL